MPFDYGMRALPTTSHSRAHFPRLTPRPRSVNFFGLRSPAPDAAFRPRIHHPQGKKVGNRVHGA